MYRYVNISCMYIHYISAILKGNKMKEIWIYACIAIVTTGILIASIASSERCAKQLTVDQPTVEQPAKIETQIQLGKIVCSTMTSDGCLEYVIYRTVKE